MKKKIRWFTILSLIIVVFFIVPNIPNYYNSLLLAFEKIPEKHNDYKFLDQISSDSNFKIKVFTSIYPEYAFKINDSLICIQTSTADKENEELVKSSWYKVNSKGNIIDSLSIIDEYLDDHGNFLVNKEKEYYLTWLIDGDTLPKPFSIIEEGKLVEKNMFKKYTDSASYSGYIYTTDSLEKRFVKTFFFKQGNWNKIYSKERFLVDEKCCTYNSLELKDIDEIAKLDFFYKKEWYGHSFPNLSLNLNGPTPEHWKGIGYYSIKVSDQKILFKRSNLRLYKDNHINTSTSLQFYENPTKNYILISRINESSQGSKQFLYQFK